MKTHGFAGRNGSAYKHQIYKTWLNMRRRCSEVNNISYHNYGGRGIKVCDRWNSSFEDFLLDMGLQPKGKTLDRIDNNQGYYKENCRWSSWIEQCLNQRSNRLITAFGKTKHLTVWATENKLASSTISKRLSSGWPAEKAVSAKVKYPGQGKRPDLRRSEESTRRAEVNIR